jgi:hypothetical protein
LKQILLCWAISHSKNKWDVGSISFQQIWQTFERVVEFDSVYAVSWMCDGSTKLWFWRMQILFNSVAMKVKDLRKVSFIYTIRQGNVVAWQSKAWIGGRISLPGSNPMYLIQFILFNPFSLVFHSLDALFCLASLH